MEDVTDRMAAGETADEIVRKAEAEGKGYKAAVEQMYYGNQQFLFLYEQFDDVRLVAAPPSSIGKFGGDTDNWIWPRHTGDFSVFRIYAGPDNKPAAYSPDNVPFRPRRHFTVSTRGVAEGDFTMIYGFPGNTQQYILSDVVKYIAETSDPMKIAIRTGRLDLISRAQESDPALRIHYAAKHASIANAWKKWQGEVLGIKRLGTYEKKLRTEQRFVEATGDGEVLQELKTSSHGRFPTTIRANCWAKRCSRSATASPTRKRPIRSSPSAALSNKHCTAWHSRSMPAAARCSLRLLNSKPESSSTARPRPMPTISSHWRPTTRRTPNSLH